MTELFFRYVRCARCTGERGEKGKHTARGAERLRAVFVSGEVIALPAGRLIPRRDMPPPVRGLRRQAIDGG